MTDTSQRLELRFAASTDGTGELSALVRSGQFAGTGSAWFTRESVEAFGRQLRDTFPLPNGSELRLLGGAWKADSDPPELEEVWLGLRVYALDALGHFGIRVEMLALPYDGQRPESRARLVVELLTDYQSLQQLGVGIARLTSDHGATAVLGNNAA